MLSAGEGAGLGAALRCRARAEPHGGPDNSQEAGKLWGRGWPPAQLAAQDLGENKSDQNLVAPCVSEAQLTETLFSDTHHEDSKGGSHRSRLRAGRGGAWR